MARRPHDRRGSQKRHLVFDYKESANFKAALSDIAVVQTRTDDIGAQIIVHFMRTDATPTGEKTSVFDEGDGRLRILGQIEVDSPNRRIIECTVMLRPDHALQLAITLLGNLSRLEPNLRAAYRIPEIEPPPAEPSP
jgi:hypothetical protein